ncbi:MAG: hypothetical protein PF541_15055 [Prolixibacteraceae bacterium]|jgi:HlyD family secretion protein|nr:hypothetical protein [Prolixibacteraceae bacterium]
MKSPIRFIFSILFVFVFYSCRNTDTSNSVLFQIQSATYTDDVLVDGTVEAVNSSTLACPRRLEGTIVFLIEEGVLVEEGDTVCILENRESENYLENLVVKVEQSKAQLAKSKADLEMQYALLEAQVQSNEAQTSITNLDTAQIKYLSIQQQKIKELELQIAVIQKEKFQKKLHFLEQINESELKKLKLQIEQDENQVDHIKSILNEMVMLAPQNGMAIRAKSWRSGEKVQEGDEVWGGMPLVKIPDKTEMKVIIQASESNYKRISEGNKVEYTFNAMPGNLAWGSIQKKAPMGKPIKRNSKVKQFEITATVDSFKVIPELGLSANCKVILTEVFDTIVIPQLAIFDEDSIKVVYVKKRKKFEKREILLGESSLKQAVIIAGLNGNEIISFQKPTKTKMKRIVLLPDSLKIVKVEPNVEQSMPIPMEGMPTEKIMN